MGSEMCIRDSLFSDEAVLGERNQAEEFFFDDFFRFVAQLVLEDAIGTEFLC